MDNIKNEIQCIVFYNYSRQESFDIIDNGSIEKNLIRKEFIEMDGDGSICRERRFRQYPHFEFERGSLKEKLEYQDENNLDKKIITVRGIKKEIKNIKKGEKNNGRRRY